MLIGIDGSEHSYKALLKSMDIQKSSNCEVIVFHSVEHHAEPSGMFMSPSFSIPHIHSISDPDIQRIKEVYELNAQAIIDRAKEIFIEEGIQIEGRLIFSDGPVSYIKKMVKEENIDLVIIGSKGTHSLLEELLLGSVTEKVLRYIPCDILIVR
ncbi:MAG: universal stress protein [Promethearchaeota archaeon]